MTVYLDLEDATSQVEYLGFYVRDMGLLHSCLARPQTTLFGEEAYPTREMKAAALLHSLATAHPLIDGNKRTAWALMVTFLAANDAEVIATADDGLEFMVSVANGSLELDDICEWITRRVISSPLD